MEEIKEIMKKDCVGVEIYGVDKENVLRRLKFEEGNEYLLIDELKKSFYFILEYDQENISDFNEQEDRKIYFYDSEKTSEIETVEKNIEKLREFRINFEKLPDFKDIKYFIYKFGDSESNFYFLRMNYSINLLKKGKLYKINKILKKEENDLIRLDGKIDIIFVDKKIYINNLKVLEKNFGFEKIIEKKAKENIKLLKELDIVVNINTLTPEENDLTFLKKLANIKKNSKVFLLKKEEIYKFVNSNEKIKNKFKIIDHKFNLDTKKSKLEFIKLLGNKFLHSELTGEDFESERNKPL